MEKQVFNISSLSISMASDLIPKSIQGNFVFKDIVAIDNGGEIAVDESSVGKLFQEILKDSESKDGKAFELQNFLENIKNVLENNPQILDKKEEKKILVEAGALSKIFAGVINPNQIKLIPLGDGNKLKLEIVNPENTEENIANNPESALNKLPSEMKLSSSSLGQEFLITIEPQEVKEATGFSKDLKTIANSPQIELVENSNGEKVINDFSNLVANVGKQKNAPVNEKVSGNNEDVGKIATKATDAQKISKGTLDFQSDLKTEVENEGQKNIAIKKEVATEEKQSKVGETKLGNISKVTTKPESPANIDEILKSTEGEIKFQQTEENKIVPNEQEINNANAKLVENELNFKNNNEIFKNQDIHNKKYYIILSFYVIFP